MRQATDGHTTALTATTILRQKRFIPLDNGRAYRCQMYESTNILGLCREIHKNSYKRRVYSSRTEKNNLSKNEYIRRCRVRG